MAIGPVQLLVLGFEQPDFHGQIIAELDRLRESDTIRLIDVLFVRKDAEGNIDRIHASDLDVEEAAELGATVGALIGFGAGGAEGADQGAIVGAEVAMDGDILPEGAWYVDDTLPPDTAAAVVLIEHRWAIGLRDAVRSAGGSALAESWVHPLDLVAIGLMAAEEAQQVTV